MAGWALSQAVPGSADHLFQETVIVDSTDADGSSTVNALEADKTYVFSVTGSYVYRTERGWAADAECSNGENDPNWLPNRYPLESEDLLDLYVDGAPVDWTSDAGACDSVGHTYTYEHAPDTPGPVTFKVSDISNDDNSGTLTVVVTEKDPLPEPSVEPSALPTIDPSPPPSPSASPSPSPGPSIDPGTLVEPLPSIEPSALPTLDPGPLPSDPGPLPSTGPSPLPSGEPSPPPIPSDDPEPSPGPTAPPTAPPTSPPTLSNPNIDPDPDPSPSTDPGLGETQALPLTGNGGGTGGTTSGHRTASGSVRRATTGGESDVEVLSSQAIDVRKPSTTRAGSSRAQGGGTGPILPAVGLAALAAGLLLAWFVRSRLAPRFVWTRSRAASNEGASDLADFWGRFDDAGDR